MQYRTVAMAEMQLHRLQRVRLPAVADSIEAGGSSPPPSTEGLSSGRLVYVKEWGASLLE